VNLKNIKNTKAIFFDLDGTLFDTAPELVEAVQRMLDELGLSRLDHDEIKSFIGRGADNLIRKSILAAGGNDQNDFESGKDLFHDFYFQLADKSQPYEGVMNSLTLLKNHGILLACVTNKPKIFTDKILSFHGLDKIMDCIISGDDVAHKKPHPEPIQLASKNLGIQPSEAIMVGDSCNDIDSVFDAGSFVATVPYGYQYGESIVSQKVDFAIQNISELTSLAQ
jgi:phosphoglycolate phosphatase